MYEVADQIETEENLDFIMNPNFCLFSDNAIAVATSRRFREKESNTKLIDHLFDDDTDKELEIMTRHVLRTYGSAMKVRLEAKLGGASEFLKGGRFHPDNITDELKELMDKTDATTDYIESFFGVLDDTISGQSDNISFHSASVMTTWRCNQTDDWLRKLTSTQRDLLISDVRRLGRGLKQAADAREV